MTGGDVDGAVQTLEEVARMGQATGNVMGPAAALANLAGLLMVRGNLRRSAAIQRRVLAMASEGRGRPLPVAGKALLGLAELHREWNDLDAATRYCVEGIELVRQYAGVGASIGYISLAYIRQAQGDSENARDLMHRAEQAAATSAVTDIDDVVTAAHRARLALAQGDVAAAVCWADERGLLSEAGLVGDERGGDGSAFLGDIRRRTELVTLAQLLMARSCHADALVLLERLLPHVETGHWERSLIQILVLEAVALQGLDRLDSALATLARALSLAEPEGYVRVFLDQGAPVARLLYEAASRGIASVYAGRLLAAFPPSVL